MNAVTVSAILESALVQVLVNIQTASAKVAEGQKNPDFEPQTLALHTRALSAQVAALKALTTILDKFTRQETPASAAPDRTDFDEKPQSAEEMLSELAALQSEIPELLKNISPLTSSPQPPATNPQPISPISPSPSQISLSPIPHSVRSCTNFQQPHTTSVSSAVKQPLGKNNGHLPSTSRF